MSFLCVVSTTSERMGGGTWGTDHFDILLRRSQLATITYPMQDVHVMSYNGPFDSEIRVHYGYRYSATYYYESARLLLLGLLPTGTYLAVVRPCSLIVILPSLAAAEERIR